MALLEVKGLKTYFYTEDGVIKAIDGVDFKVDAGETLGIVGESGCGKSVTAMSILRLVAGSSGKIVEGSINFDGTDILLLTDKEMRSIRGNKISMIFQEPMTSLNPVFTINQQMSEVLLLHRNMTKEEAKQEVIKLLQKVGIPRPSEVVDDYPFTLSGGMRQRVMIAMALACNPKLLIADEPTTALDVTIQAQVLDLMNKLQKEFGTAIMFITHDLNVIAEMASRVIVMYSGKVVEESPVVALFDNPCHPYTIGLMKSKPDIKTSGEKLYMIPGVVPNPLYRPAGCQFNTRCEYAIEKCFQMEPDLTETTSGGRVRCFRWQEVQELRGASYV
ncbi:ABC transporter ATP-binding protein [Fusibacter ferrireducens]|uniref:ABC transporter ATP-binding protein n=1 Tax=Fusibacter ferrireducens TaxID=2785058 RepID=A0ABR9ZYZ5_9FIRM|nr:ABC transporter ATP-binding protein [Fusibacter ferrireducens]MBF4695682.1 ABC transporter ATP-binding protein [Fusibacter ferrireducens]